ncbi:hypothetical protein HGRIS_006133 [Hohenbuehelia grisea]|uniref:F-box domain-containing protein n=1 Tax=Hohenbuehelia grisea TaxID=104357 RepID=A0ABR3K067_9AGAR
MTITYRLINLNRLPIDLFLEILSFLPLPDLIRARCVCQHWRRLALKASLTPSRRRLLQLYYDILASPAFIPTRSAVIDYLRPFDRADYVQNVYAAMTLLLKQPRFESCHAASTGTVSSVELCYLPLDFETWVMEWPARAVISWAWPGLDTMFGAHNGGPICPYGANRLSPHRKPTWLPFQPEEDEEAHGQSFHRCNTIALEVWDEGSGKSQYLMLTPCAKRLWGGVYSTQPGGVREPVAETWIGYQRDTLKRLERWFQENNRDA